MTVLKTKLIAALFAALATATAALAQGGGGTDFAQEVAGYWRGQAGVYAITDKAIFLNGSAADQARHPILVVERAVSRSGEARRFARSKIFGDAQTTQIPLLREKDELLMGFPTGPVRLSRVEHQSDPHCFDTRPNPEALFGLWRMESGAMVRISPETVTIEGSDQRVLRYRVESGNLAVFEIAPEDAEAGLTRGQENPIYAGVPVGMDAAIFYIPSANGGIEEISLIRPVSECFPEPG